MTWLITVRDAAGARSYTAIGNRDALMDAAYDAGALSLTIKVRA
jgi:hypothetical protein